MEKKKTREKKNRGKLLVKHKSITTLSLTLFSRLFRMKEVKAELTRETIRLYTTLYTLVSLCATIKSASVSLKLIKCPARLIVSVLANKAHYRELYFRYSRCEYRALFELHTQSHLLLSHFCGKKGKTFLRYTSCVCLYFCIIRYCRKLTCGKYTEKVLILKYMLQTE